MLCTSDSVWFSPVYDNIPSWFSFVYMKLVAWIMVLDRVVVRYGCSCDFFYFIFFQLLHKGNKCWLSVETCLLPNTHTFIFCSVEGMYQKCSEAFMDIQERVKSFGNIHMSASFLDNKLQELERIKLMPPISIQSGPNFLGLLLVPIHGSLPVLARLQQLKEGGNFSEWVLCLKGEQLVSLWDQRTDKKLASVRVTQWPLLWIWVCFSWKIKQISYWNIAKLLTRVF